MPPRKFWNLDAWKCYFHRFPDSIWALRTMKFKNVYYNRSFPQNLNHWLLEKSEGDLGAYRPREFWDLDAWKCYFHCFPDSIWALKIKTLLSKFYVYYNRSFPQNLNLWLLREKSEMINLQMRIQKNTFNALSSSSPFEKVCSAMSASVSLARTPFWNVRKPGI